MTLQQQPKAEAMAPKPDVFNRNCPSRRVLTGISGKWSLLVIDALQDGAMRTGALRRRVDGISQKMLTETLRSLEKLNLVHRRSLETIPPHVEYALTDLGQATSQQIGKLDRWIEANLDAFVCPSARTGPSMDVTA
jgi:DNA-binding HxlR family transcriptional regulator